jgi:hypothetical protein
MRNGEWRMLCFIRCAFQCISQPSPDLPRQLKQALTRRACLAPSSSYLPLPLHVGTPSSPHLLNLISRFKFARVNVVICNLFPGDLVAAFSLPSDVFVSILGCSLSSFNGGGWWTMAGGRWLVKLWKEL